MNPRIAAEVGAPLRSPRHVAMQFRYAFVTDAEELKVIDVTFPDRPRAIEGALVPMAGADGLYLARTYAYVAAGSAGHAIVDVERPVTNDPLGPPSSRDRKSTRLNSSHSRASRMPSSA